MTERMRLNEGNRKWWTLAAMCFALFMIMLDNTVVNVALPSIQRSFDASLSSLEWTINAYSLAFAVLLVTGGRLGDIFGRRKVFLIGVVIFAAASATAARNSRRVRGVPPRYSRSMTASSVARPRKGMQRNERPVAASVRAEWTGTIPGCSSAPVTSASSRNRRRLDGSSACRSRIALSATSRFSSLSWATKTSPKPPAAVGLRTRNRRPCKAYAGSMRPPHGRETISARDNRLA